MLYIPSTKYLLLPVGLFQGPILYKDFLISLILPQLFKTRESFLFVCFDSSPHLPQDSLATLYSGGVTPLGPNTQGNQRNGGDSSAGSEVSAQGHRAPFDLGERDIVARSVQGWGWGKAAYIRAARRWRRDRDRDRA